MSGDEKNDSSKNVSINPRPRIRRAVADPPLTQLRDATSPGAAPAANPGGKRRKRQATGSYKIGWCRPPLDGQFKKDNPGGPGRPRGSKSQDTLLRAELSAKQIVRMGGRDEKVSKRELATKLYVNGALEKRDPKHLGALMTEARRLFPEPVAEDAAHDANDPAVDLALLQQLMDHFTLREPSPDAPNPLADLAASGPDLGTDGAAWNEGDWDIADREASDDDQ